MLSPRRPEVVSKLKITFNAERTVIKRLYLKIGVEIKESRIVRKKIGGHCRRTIFFFYLSRLGD